jgi:hypothetical protein
MNVIMNEKTFPMKKNFGCVRCRQMKIRCQLSGESCLQCQEADTVCHFLGKVGATKQWGELFKLNHRVEDLANASSSQLHKKGTGTVRFANNLVRKSRRFDKVLKLWNSFSDTFGQPVPSLTAHPNAKAESFRALIQEYPQESSNVVDVSQINPTSVRRKISERIFDQETDRAMERFSCPSSELLDAIHYRVAKRFELLAESHGEERRGKLLPSTLVALGVLVQELIYDQMPEYHQTTLTDEQVNLLAPNRADLIGKGPF